jgi:hypothetical protein
MCDAPRGAEMKRWIMEHDVFPEAECFDMWLTEVITVNHAISKQFHTLNPVVMGTFVMK